MCIQSVRQGDLIYFTHEGGVDVGDVDAKALKLMVPVGTICPSEQDITTTLLTHVKSSQQKKTLVSFITRLYLIYADLHFTYLEINPLVVLESADKDPQVFYLDLAAKLDQTAEAEVGKKWAEARIGAYHGPDVPAWGPDMEFPAPFGRQMTAEESYIADLDAKTGASLKLTVLNASGRIWTMVAGGGASVVYSDAIAAHGYADELANYGEYSGAPSESQTFEYAKTILDLMTRGAPHPKGKFLFIGGGIANFTNVASTFKGIIKALKAFQSQLQLHKVKIYVRRAGPNWQEGLRLMREVGDNLGVEMHIYGPEMHVTGIVPLALQNSLKGLDTASDRPVQQAFGSVDSAPEMKKAKSTSSIISPVAQPAAAAPGDYVPFSNVSRAFVYGMQPKAVQGMLDYDFMCKRETPSVACMIYPFGGHHVQKMYWGVKETLLPVYTTTQEACEKFPDVDIIVNFASSRRYTLAYIVYTRARAR